VINFYNILAARKNIEKVDFGNLYSYADISSSRNGVKKHWATVMVNEDFNQFVVYTTMELNVPDDNGDFLNFAIMEEKSLDAVITYHQAISILYKAYRETHNDPSITFTSLMSEELVTGTIISIADYCGELEESTPVELEVDFG
jgi:hypothetical protein